MLDVGPLTAESVREAVRTAPDRHVRVEAFANEQRHDLMRRFVEREVAAEHPLAAELRAAVDDPFWFRAFPNALKADSSLDGRWVSTFSAMVIQHIRAWEARYGVSIPRLLMTRGLKRHASAPVTPNVSPSPALPPAPPAVFAAPRPLPPPPPPPPALLFAEFVVHEPDARGGFVRQYQTLSLRDVTRARVALAGTFEVFLGGAWLRVEGNIDLFREVWDQAKRSA